MGMLIDVIDKKINELKDLRQREERRDNQAAQDALDAKYKILTDQIHRLLLALRYAKDNMSFRLSDDVLNDLDTILIDQKKTVESGYADKDMVNKVENELKSINVIVKKEWSKQYTTLTNATVGMLKVIAGIDSEKVSECLEGISKGENWTTNINEFKAMNKSLSDADTLILELGLDEQIITFLRKMNSGKATVVDLDEKVLSWLKNENIDKKVRLSFNVNVKRS